VCVCARVKWQGQERRRRRAAASLLYVQQGLVVCFRLSNKERHLVATQHTCIRPLAETQDRAKPAGTGTNKVPAVSASFCADPSLLLAPSSCSLW
jgi:hypothetical protein